MTRPVGCQCLGGFLKREHSLRALDSYCRREAYRIADRPKEVGGRQVYPEKSRCGSLDPILMRLDQKCQCLTKDVQGADNAFWVKQEIFGIPWNDNFANFDSQDFKDAKYRTEKAFDEHFLRQDVIDRFFDKGYVRSGKDKLEGYGRIT